MRLDIAKIDDRIKKLQELKRIASDPDIADMISQCLTPDEVPVSAPPAVPVVETPKTPAESENNTQGKPDEADAMIQSILSGGQWGRRAR